MAILLQQKNFGPNVIYFVYMTKILYCVHGRRCRDVHAAATDENRANGCRTRGSEGKDDVM